MFASDSTYLIRPQDQRYWKAIAYLLKPLGIGAQEWWGFPMQPPIFTVLFYITIIFGPASFVSQIVFFCLHYKEYPFFQLGNIFAVIMVAFVIIMKMMCARKASYERIMREFMSNIHLYYYEPRSPYVEKTLTRMERYTRLAALGIILCTEVDREFWMILPIINNYLTGAFNSNGTVRFQTCMYMVMPFDYEHSFQNWLIMHILNFYDTLFGCGVYAVSDTVLFGIIFHLIGRIMILKHNFKDLKSSFDKFSEYDIKEKLGICIRDHVLIFQSFNELQDAFGISVTGTYAVNAIMDSLILLEFQYGDRSAKYTYSMMVVIHIGGLILMSLVMESIRNQSDDLSDVVYAVPWERMSVPNQKILLIILARIQPILVFKAFGGLQAGIQPAVSIMKSTFSYYVMLKSRSERFET